MSLPRWLSRWSLPLALTALCLLLQAAGLVEPLRYERAALQAGQWWRLLTGNLVHLGWSHLLMDLAGLWLIWWFFVADLRPAEWAWLLLVSGLAVTGGLYTFDPHLVWYVGLSGLLHGLLVGGALRVLPRELPFGVLLLGGVAFKLYWEQTHGALPGTAALAGGPVVVDAHLYGALGGALGYALLQAGLLLRRAVIDGDRQ